MVFRRRVSVDNRISPPSVAHRQEMVLAPKGPGMDQQSGRMGIRDQAGRRQRSSLGVARFDQQLARPDRVGIAAMFFNPSGDIMVATVSPVPAAT